MIDKNRIEKIFKEISSLDTDEKLSILKKLILEISLDHKNKKKLNICDIKGIGKEVWKNIDVDDYVNKER